jgi:hypothetical protein
LIALIALGVRWANVMVLRPTAETGTGTADYVLGGDSQIYHYQAHALAEGHGYLDPARWLFLDKVEKSAVSPPVYSTYLGAWSWLGVRSVTGHRLVSGLLGVGSVVLLGLAARTMAGPVAGLCTAAVGAVYPGLWINDGMLLSECAAIFGVGLFLWATYRLWAVLDDVADAPRQLIGPLVAAALASGVVGLTRTELLLLFPVGLVPILLRTRHRDRWKWVLFATAVAGFVVVPWLVRNLVSFEEPTLLGGQTGTVLAAGSCDEVFGGERIGLYTECFDDFPTAAEEAAMDESQRDLAPRRYAFDYLGDNLDRLPKVMGARVGRVWMVFRPLHTTRTVDIAVERRGSSASWAALWMYYALLPFAAVGLAALRRRGVPVLPIVALVVTVTLSAAITFGNTRYRAPFEAGLVVLAGVGLAHLVAWYQQRGSGASTVSGAVQ